MKFYKKNNYFQKFKNPIQNKIIDINNIFKFKFTFNN